MACVTLHHWFLWVIDSAANAKDLFLHTLLVVCNSSCSTVPGKASHLKFLQTSDHVSSHFSNYPVARARPWFLSSCQLHCICYCKQATRVAVWLLLDIHHTEMNRLHFRFEEAANLQLCIYLDDTVHAVINIHITSWAVDVTHSHPMIAMDM